MRIALAFITFIAVLPVTVRTAHAALNSVLISPDTVYTIAGGFEMFEAYALYDSSAPDTVTYDSANVIWWTTDSSDTLYGGGYSPKTQGTQLVVVEYMGFADTAYAFVAHDTAADMDILPGTLALAPGDTGLLTAMLYDVYGNSWDSTGLALFYQVPVMDSGIMVSANGIYASGPGTYYVRGLIDSLSDTVVVFVARTDTQTVSDTGAVSFSVPEVTIELRELGGSGGITVQMHDDAPLPYQGQMTAAPGAWFGIHADAGIDSFTAVIRLSYTQEWFDASGIAAESLLQCLRLEDTVWTAFPSSVDTLNNVVSCVTDGFSYWTYGECTGIGGCECDMEILSTPFDTAYVGDTYMYVPDVFGGSLSGINQDAPAGIIRTGTAIIWTPDAADKGSHDISLLFTGNCRDTVQSFTLHVIDESQVPVELSSFAAKASGNGVELRWRTETEEENLGFNVERSNVPDGEFTRINTVLIPGAGTTTVPQDYTWTDTGAGAGERLYRLVIIALDGTAEYSDAVAVTAGVSGIANVPGIRVDAGRVFAPAGAAVMLTDNRGTVVYRAVASGPEGNGITLPAGLGAGVYILTVAENGCSTTKKILLVH